MSKFYVSSYEFAYFELFLLNDSWSCKKKSIVMNEKIKIIFNDTNFSRLIKTKIRNLRIKYRKQIIGNDNKIINKGMLSKVRYDIVGNNNTVEIMKGTVLSNFLVYIRGDNHKFTIEENCIFKDGSVWFEDSNCEIYIGKNTTIESAHIAVTEPERSIIIGEDCMFSSGIEFRTGDSHSIIDNAKRKRINQAQNIVVGNHVWIGRNSTILKGVNIGNNSIIGLGSIVTGNVPSNVIAAGIPAKVLKNNIDWLRERI